MGRVELIIKTWRDPYEAGFSPTRPKEIELHLGLTVLVGCNGAGKSTLLRNVYAHCKDNYIPVLRYNNLSDGGSSSIGELMYMGNYADSAGLMMASEGEAIKSNIGRLSTNFGHFFEKGYIDDYSTRLSRVFASNSALKEQDERFAKSNERVLLFDAVDSGLSVDSVVEIKELFELMVNDIKSYAKDIYILIAANEYELARNVDCFDVNAGKYLTFNDYEDYRNFILQSRQRKEKRLKKQAIWWEKQHQKELVAYKKIKEETDAIVQKIIDDNGGERPTWSSNYKAMRALNDEESKLKDFIRHSKYITKEELSD